VSAQVSVDPQLIRSASKSWSRKRCWMRAVRGKLDAMALRLPLEQACNSSLEISELIKAGSRASPRRPNQTQARYFGHRRHLAAVSRLADVMQGEMLEFPQNTFASALISERGLGGRGVLGAYEHIREGNAVKCTAASSKCRWAEALSGASSTRSAADRRQRPDRSDRVLPHRENRAGRIWRKSVAQPVQTGLKSIDSMVPIDAASAKLIIGDRQTARRGRDRTPSFNQKGKDLICIYVAIGQKASRS